VAEHRHPITGDLAVMDEGNDGRGCSEVENLFARDANGEFDAERCEQISSPCPRGNDAGARPDLLSTGVEANSVVHDLDSFDGRLVDDAHVGVPRTLVLCSLRE